MSYDVLKRWMEVNNLSSKRFVELQDFEDFDHQDFSEAADSIKFIETLHSRKDTRHVVVDTDYDVDGICSERVIKNSLKKFGFKVSSYYPTEHDGYGLTIDEAKHLLEQYPDVSLVITADNGINCKEAIDYLHERSVEVLVSDHHKGEVEKFPDKALVCVNVNRADKEDGYRFKHISGAQTAYKLMQMYADRYCDQSIQSYVRALKIFASISILSDIMLMDGENRRDVKDLLKTFNSKRIDNLALVNDAIKSLKFFVDHFGQREITLDSFGFAIIPTLNSARRMLGESELAFKALDQDTRIAEISTNALMRLNDLRKAEKKEAMHMLDVRVDTDQLSIVVTDAKAGILGLIASDITSSKHKSSLAFKRIDDRMKASGRGYDKNSIFDILALVKSRRKDLEFGFGGHSHALGCEVAAKDFDEFCKEAEIAARDLYLDVEMTKLPSVEISLSDLLDNKEFLVDAKRAKDAISTIEPLPYYLSNLTFSVETSTKELMSRGFKYFGTNFEHLKYESSGFEVVMFYNADLVKYAQDKIRLNLSARFEKNLCQFIVESVEVK